MYGGAACESGSAFVVKTGQNLFASCGNALARRSFCISLKSLRGNCLKTLKSESPRGKPILQGCKIEIPEGKSILHGCKIEIRGGKSILQGCKIEIPEGKLILHGCKIEIPGGKSILHGCKAKFRRGDSQKRFLYRFPSRKIIFAACWPFPFEEIALKRSEMEFPGGKSIFKALKIDFPTRKVIFEAL